MKKVFTILAIAAIASAAVLSFSSCGKKCTCTYYKGGKKMYSKEEQGTKYYGDAYDNSDYGCVKNEDLYDDWSVKCK